MQYDISTLIFRISLPCSYLAIVQEYKIYFIAGFAVKQWSRMKVVAAGACLILVLRVAVAWALQTVAQPLLVYNDARDKFEVITNIFSFNSLKLHNLIFF